MKKFCLLTICAITVLAGCGSDSASYLVGGDRDNAFSIFRGKSYPGADWELELVLTHLPDCQRRYPLKDVPSDRPYKAALFIDAEGYYLLQSATAWYEVQMNGCVLKEIKPVTNFPGNLVGSWEERDTGFKFFPASK